MTLVERYAEKYEVTKREARQIIANFTGILQDALDDEGRAVINNVGTIKIVAREERAGHNPVTGESITIPAHKSIKIVPCKAYKEHLNK